MLKPPKALLKMTSISSKLKQFHKCFEFKNKIQPLIFLLSLLLVLPNLFELEHNNSTKNFKEVSKINLFCLGTIAVFFLFFFKLSSFKCFILLVYCDDLNHVIYGATYNEQENDLLNT